MAQDDQSHTYKQGHSTYTHATQQLRTAEVEAAFLLPHIKPTSHILDIGCGPGTITAGLTKHVPSGLVIGLDISSTALEKAQTFAQEAQIPSSGPGSLTFEQGNLLDRLPFADACFDIVFASQVFGHIPGEKDPLLGLAEIQRVLKPGGIIATRDGMEQHFYPAHFDLDRFWYRNSVRAVVRQQNGGRNTQTHHPASRLPLLFRSAGFSSISLSASTTSFSGAETRKMLAWRAAGQLEAGDAVHKSWIEAGISEEEISKTVGAVQKWADTQDAWCVVVQCEVLGWKGGEVE